MPFRKRCKITMENCGEQEQALFYMIEGWKGELPGNAGYFHAAYRQEHPVQKGRAYTVIDGIQGKGQQADFMEYAALLEEAYYHPVCRVSKPYRPAPGIGGCCGVRGTAERVQDQQGDDTASV